jgi:hypothetical protein
MVTRKDYNEIAVRAARSVMLELLRILGEYRDDIAVVGGWVPALLLESAEEKHIGSIDVDIALNHKSIDAPGYNTIRKLLIKRGYKAGDQPFIFFRSVIIEDTPVEVQVDFLAGEYEGTSKSHRTQIVQDLRARKARGCELAFELQNEIIIEGVLPEGGNDSVSVHIAGIVPFIIMKGMAMYDRIKEKDAWDIYYCVKNYPKGIDKLVEDFRPVMSNGLVTEGLKKIAGKFAAIEHFGPVSVAAFEELTDPEERALRQRDAYERIYDLLSKLGIAMD